MNYSAHHDRLIARARSRTLTGYCERHHVVPKCMGGGNEAANLVDLTAEEHYVAHQLLVKMYPGIRGLAIAAVRMSRQCTGNKAYGWLRRRVSMAQIGKQLSMETRAKLSAALMGHKRNLGKKRSLSAIEKTTAANRGQKRSAEVRARMSASMLGKPHTRGWKMSPERRAKISAALLGNKNGIGNSGPKGLPVSPEKRALLSAAHSGKKKSPEAIAKSAEARRGQKRSLESRARMSAARLAYLMKNVCTRTATCQA